MLLLHCSLARHETLLPLSALLEPEHAVTLFDLPGHGRSADWDGVSDYQALTTAVAAALATPGSHLIGHSFGATVALRLAVERPDLVSRLTLIEPPFFAAAREEPEYAPQMARAGQVQAAFDAGDYETAARLFTTDWGDGDWEGLLPHVRAGIIKRIHLIGAAAPALSDDNGGLLRPGAIDHVRVPVTLIQGARSPAVVDAIHRALARMLLQARRITVPDAGHMSPITHPDAVFKALL